MTIFVAIPQVGKRDPAGPGQAKKPDRPVKNATSGKFVGKLTYIRRKRFPVLFILCEISCLSRNFSIRVTIDMMLMDTDLP